MSNQVSKPDDASLVVIYKELLMLRSTVDMLQDKICDLEKNLAEMAQLGRQRRKSALSLSPLQQKIVVFLRGGGKTQGEIVAALDMPQASVSHSLSKLDRELSIVESKPTTKTGARFEYVLKRKLSPEILELLSQL